MSQRINGALISYGSIVINIGVALVFTPFFVRSLGQAGYGLFSIVIAFAAYLNMLDFGMNDSLLRNFVSRRNDPNIRDRFLARMLSFYAGIGVLILLAGQALALLFPVIFKASMSPEEIALLSSMIQVMSIGAAVLIAFNPLGALLYANERFVFMKSAEMAVMLGTTLLIVGLLLKGYGIFSVVIVTALGKVFQAGIRIVYAIFALKVRLRYSIPEWNELRTIILYAAPIFVSIVAGQLFSKLDNILIGALLGAAPVAVYAIGIMFNKYFMSFATAISRIMTPEIIKKIDSGSDAETLNELMVRVSRVQAIALLLILGGLIVFGKRFLTLWLGADYEVSYFVMLAVLCPYALELTGNARNIILQVKGLYWHKSIIIVVMAALNVPLTVLFLNIFGVVGAAFSTGIAMLGGYFMIARLLQKRVGLSMLSYWKDTAHGILPISLLIIGTGVLMEQYLPQGWYALIFGASLFTVVYAVSIIKYAANEYERALLGRVFQRLGF